MSRQIFGDVADVGQLLQVGVHLLIAAYGKQHAVRLAVGVIPVTVDNFLRLVKQRDVAHVLGLLPRLADPDLAVDVHHEMLRLELLHVRKGQPRQTAETEDARCSALSCCTSVKASPVRQQKQKMSRTCASRGIEIALLSMAFSSCFSRNSRSTGSR